MKAITLLIPLLITCITSQAQDIYINFAGSGESTVVDSVKVQNLTQCKSLVMNGTDTLHLIVTVGIPPLISKNNCMIVYPNPITEYGLIEFDNTVEGKVTIELIDINGKQVIQVQNILQRGHYKYSIGDLGRGAYTIRISTKENIYIEKFICRNADNGPGELKYVSYNSYINPKGNIKDVNSQITMQYTNNDQLLFTCYSGVYTTEITLIPTQSITVIANFIQYTDTDGHNYSTVTIGSQVWMAQNLNVGVRINSSNNQLNNGVIEKYCYNNYESNCNAFGGLYQWNEMMQYETNNGCQGICPSGWHIPTDQEYQTLSTFLGGGTVSGMKKKAACNQFCYYYPYSSNSSGFSALAGGVCDYTGLFYEQGNEGIFWSSTQNGTTDGWAWGCTCGSNYEYRLTMVKLIGFSVRCMKN